MFTLPPLPFQPNEVHPVLNQETLDFHYGKHHQAYCNNLNNFLTEENLSYPTIEAIVRDGKNVSPRIKNNAGGVWNHAFYWNALGTGTRTPVGTVATLIDAQFSSFENFQKEFAAKAMSVFGSGWTWLVLDDQQQLQLINTPNQDHPWQDNPSYTPLFVLDVWEHAYYIQHRNLRAEYISSFWSIVSWEKIEEHFTSGYLL